MRRLLALLLPATGLLLAAPLAAQEADAVRVFHIDAGESRLYVRLYRKGLLSPLSHDHVMVARGIAGRVMYHPQAIGQSSLQLSVPVESLEADPPALRRELGLKGGLDAEDRQEISETMLSEDYLAAAANPRIVATADQVRGAPPALELVLNLRIKQTQRDLTVPVEVEVSDDTLRARGTVRFLQSDFGVEPFSSMLGTLAVKDEVSVHFDIVAHEQP